MKGVLTVAAAALIGVLLGLLVTAHSLEADQIGTQTGPWRGASTEPTADSDPYVLAATARDGRLPLGPAEGLGFIARQDDDGRWFRGDCTYVIEGPMPTTRFWTVSLLTPRGFPVADPADRYAFTSAEVLRFVGEPVRIRVSSQAEAGNWLPTGKASSFVLMLRLYDTGLSTVGARLDAASMPHIRRVACQ